MIVHSLQQIELLYPCAARPASGMHLQDHNMADEERVELTRTRWISCHTNKCQAQRLSCTAIESASRRLLEHHLKRGLLGCHVIQARLLERGGSFLPQRLAAFCLGCAQQLLVREIDIVLRAQLCVELLGVRVVLQYVLYVRQPVGVALAVESLEHGLARVW